MNLTARLIALKPRKGTQRQVLSLKNEETVVGRQAGCKIRIPSPSVSRQHCRLAFLNDVLTAEDLGSSNGTFINDVRIQEQSYVKPGDVLRVGPFRFFVDYRLSDRAVRHLIDYLAGETADESIDVEVVDSDMSDIVDAAVALEVAVEVEDST